MRTDIKELWVAALRSGAYRQGTGALKVTTRVGEGTGYCCLGVLCELAVTAGMIPPPTKTDGLSSDHWTYGIGESVHDTILPAIVRDWAGILSRNPAINGHPQSTLAGANDSGLSFGEIADIIEEQL
jgi:hypothetical protein